MAKKVPEINASSTADIAFLLLAFFLATTTMNVDSGIYRRLPPYQPEDQKAPEVAERNVLKILVNQNDMIMVNDAPADVTTIKDKTIEFINQQLGVLQVSLSQSESAMTDFRQENKFVDVSSYAGGLMAKVSQYDQQK